MEPATVKKLEQVLLNTTPPNMKFDVKHQLPIDPKSRQEMMEVVKTGKVENIIAFAQNIIDPSYTEVYPRIFIGNKKSFNDLGKLKDIGITRVLNLAHSTDDQLVDRFALDPEELKKFGVVSYKGIEMSDSKAHDEDNLEHENKLMEGVDFMNEALNSSESDKIMVNCFGGISRSSTVIMSYLILKKKMSAQEAIRTVRSKHEAIPSKQHLANLAIFHNRVHGFKDVDVIDDSMDLDMARKLLNSSGKA